MDCKVDDCRTKSKVKGWCSKHYMQNRRTGDPIYKKPHKPSIIETVEYIWICEWCGIPFMGSSNSTVCSIKCGDARKSITRRYKLTIVEYKAMLSNGCAVCGTTEGKLCIDHDHSCCNTRYLCGKCTRGILCDKCNAAEGFLGSDPARARALADYMDSYSL